MEAWTFVALYGSKSLTRDLCDGMDDQVGQLKLNPRHGKMKIQQMG